jgi:hypothetical protein
VTELSAPPTQAPDAGAKRRAQRPPEPPQRFAQAPIARLIKALRLANALVELGELKAAAAYLRIAAALDRYHEVARGSPPPLRSAKAPPRALPAPAQALTFINHESTGLGEAQGATEEPGRWDSDKGRVDRASMPRSRDGLWTRPGGVSDAALQVTPGSAVTKLLETENGAKLLKGNDPRTRRNEIGVKSLKTNNPAKSLIRGPQ